MLAMSRLRWRKRPRCSCKAEANDDLRASHLRDCLNELPEHARQVLRQRYELDSSFAQMAELAGTHRRSDSQTALSAETTIARLRHAKTEFGGRS